MLSAAIFAFGVGAVSTANPCGFAFLPIYFTHRLGSPESRRGTAIFSALSAGSLATAGFVIVFGIFGGLISLGAIWLIGALPWAGFAAVGMGGGCC